MRIESHKSVYTMLVDAADEENAKGTPPGGRVAHLSKAEMAVLDDECDVMGMIPTPSYMIAPKVMGFVIVVTDAETGR